MPTNPKTIDEIAMDFTLGITNMLTEDKVVNPLAPTEKLKADLSTIVRDIIGKNESAEPNIYSTQQGTDLWRYQEDAKAHHNSLREKQRQKAKEYGLEIKE